MKLENSERRLVTEVFHKSSHEPYFLPLISMHAHHIRKDIPLESLVRESNTLQPIILMKVKTFRYACHYYLMDIH